MVNFKRVLNIDLPPGQSAFLWGARKTGKTTYLKKRFPNSVIYDFLKTDLFFSFTKKPYLLREQLLAMDKSMLQSPVILDEVQKVPQILDEVHWLIENRGIRFILCGSSARKLKKGHINLLGGRAWRYEMRPLVFPEIGPDNIDLLKILNRGLIPDHFNSVNYRKSLQAYILNYLKEEIFAEGLVRNIPAFSRFFDTLTYSHGQQINFSNIARETGVDSKTVREYFQILIDTLLGVFVIPFKKRQDRNIITKIPKFYLFDVGVAGAIAGRNIVEQRGVLFGQAFEHYILSELIAYRSYLDLDFDINYWRTKSGTEVDFILGNGELALEIKGSGSVDKKDLRGLKSFINQYRPARGIVVCNEVVKRIHEDIEIMPYKIFLEELWEGKII